MAKRNIFITGIGTDIGKTLVSAILTEKLKADYWKPVQSGELDKSDTIKVKSLITNPVSVFHSETHRLTQPYSPHKSAALDGVEIDPQQFVLPTTNNTLIIEGAGGLMVPLNNNFLLIDLIKLLNVEVVLVSQNYLGSINHTILSAQALKQYQIPVAGIIFNGDKDAYSEDFILQYTGLKYLGHIPTYTAINKANIIEAGHHINL